MQCKSIILLRVEMDGVTELNRSQERNRTDDMHENELGCFSTITVISFDQVTVFLLTTDVVSRISPLAAHVKRLALGWKIMA